MAQTTTRPAFTLTPEEALAAHGIQLGAHFAAIYRQQLIDGGVPPRDALDLARAWIAAFYAPRPPGTTTPPTSTAPIPATPGQYL